MGHVISFFASGNKATLNWISDVSDMQAFVSAVKARQVGGIQSSAAAPPPTQVDPPSASTAAPGTDAQHIMDEIRQLAELHTSGILTDEEFNAKKAELLARL